MVGAACTGGCEHAHTLGPCTTEEAINGHCCATSSTHIRSHSHMLHVTHATCYTQRTCAGSCPRATGSAPGRPHCGSPQPPPHQQQTAWAGGRAAAAAAGPLGLGARMRSGPACMQRARVSGESQQQAAYGPAATTHIQPRMQPHPQRAHSHPYAPAARTAGPAETCGRGGCAGAAAGPAGPPPRRRLHPPAPLPLPVPPLPALRIRTLGSAGAPLRTRVDCLLRAWPCWEAATWPRARQRTARTHLGWAPVGRRPRGRCCLGRLVGGGGPGAARWLC